MVEESLELDPFQDDQYGFRRKVSTVDALRRVMDLADLSKRRNRICVLAAVGVMNVFKTFSWNKILEEAESRGKPRKLATLLEKYLEDGKIVVRMTRGTLRRNVYAGVLQGSILGPLLWHLVHDDLQKKLKAIPKMNPVAFADDLAVILDIAKQEESDNKLSTP